MRQLRRCIVYSHGYVKDTNHCRRYGYLDWKWQALRCNLGLN
jgi:hypothetical protein